MDRPELHIDPWVKIPIVEVPRCYNLYRAIDEIASEYTLYEVFDMLVALLAKCLHQMDDEDASLRWERLPDLLISHMELRDQRKKSTP